MGTRAAFFIGDPRDIENREWLGCIAWDGNPDGDCAVFAGAKTKDQFRKLVGDLAATRPDFAHPDKGGFPFPWTDALFLTDCVYGFFDAAAHVDFNCNWRTVKWMLEADAEEQDRWYDEHSPDPSFENVPAPGGKWDRSQPDSIMIVPVPTEAA